MRFKNIRQHTRCKNNIEKLVNEIKEAVQSQLYRAEILKKRLYRRYGIDVKI